MHADHDHRALERNGYVDFNELVVRGRREQAHGVREFVRWLSHWFRHAGTETGSDGGDKLAA